MVEIMQSSMENPFALRSVANDTRYSEEERKRIEKVTAKNNFKFFDNYEIDETRGDRLILICEPPSIEKLLSLKHKL